MVGVGAGAAGTSVLAMLASRVAPRRHAAAASAVWMMMILGFAISAPLAGHFLDPFSNARLITVTATVCATTFAIATLAILGVEGRAPSPSAPRRTTADDSRFVDALKEVWAETAARRFTIFIFVSMLAYSAQELLVEPFAGLVFGMTPGATTKLAGLQHAGVLTGMLSAAIAASAIGGPILGSLRLWTIGGCVASALALVSVAMSGFLSRPGTLLGAVFALGVSNGVFAVAAIGSMMGLAGSGASARAGTRMGLWGAAQAIAFGLGGVSATALVDLGRALSASPLVAYALVFAAEAALFLYAAGLARSSSQQRPRDLPICL